MDESLLTNVNDSNATKETEASLSYEEYKPSKAKDLRSHIITAVGLNLLDIIKENSQYKNYITKDKFYLSHLPSISLNDYIKRLVKYTNMDISTLINAIIYMDTFCEKQNYILCMNNVYLVLLSVCLLSYKFNEDVPINLKNYAQIAGISLENLISLEFALHSNLLFDLFVKEDLYKTYYDYFSKYEIPMLKKDKEV
jgi:hypothetical protein